MTEVVAIIPARGGSKGVPGKNLRPLAGKPLLVWSIEQALACGSVGRVVVSTDSEEIATVARAAGADVPALRPAELATDTAPTEPALLHMLDVLSTGGYRPDATMLLQPTSPLRRPETLDAALRLYESSRADSLLGVIDTHAFFWREAGGEATADYDWMKRPRRQDIAPADRKYRETGSVYVTRTELLRTSGNRLGGKIVLFRMREEEGWEIDTEADFLVLEGLMARAEPRT